MVLLGIGEEGHTASIFPNSPLLDESKKWVKDIWVTEKQMDRISFTMPFINQAKNIVFLVSGQSKIAILKKYSPGQGQSYRLQK
jgi:6-phosphogluconolactonase